ncbi:MAG: glycosyltransferase [Phycisphaerae bacterium]
MKKIRVARIITRLNVGGPAYQAVLLNHLLPDRGYEALLIHGTVPPGEIFFGDLLEKYPGDTYPCRKLSRKIAPLADFAALVDLVKVLKKFRPDIVHTHTAKAGLLGRLAAKMTGARVLIHTYHGHVLEGYFSSPLEKMILYTEKFLAKFTDRLVCISPKLTTELSQKFKIAPIEKFATIELGLPLNRFTSLPGRGPLRTKFNIPDDAIVLGSLGRLVPIKNYHRMLCIFHNLLRMVPNKKLYLLIGGTGPLENELKDTARKFGLTENVFFPGLVRDLPQFYADIDIGILTSDNEGTPVTILEAQAAGKYVVAPDVGGIGDILDPRAGALISPNEVDAYVHSLCDIINNWSTLKTSGEQVRSATIERFSPDRLANDLDYLYRKLLQEKENV